ncbi:hypothetical protein B0H13DRAFT_1853192 [Mycena leptocephala]|nr:hypothetical protein B0H13DRAFT_1853192 [Mycena leptocephala]
MSQQPSKTHGVWVRTAMGDLSTSASATKNKEEMSKNQTDSTQMTPTHETTARRNKLVHRIPFGAGSVFICVSLELISNKPVVIFRRPGDFFIPEVVPAHHEAASAVYRIPVLRYGDTHFFFFFSSAGTSDSYSITGAIASIAASGIFISLGDGSRFRTSATLTSSDRFEKDVEDSRFRRSTSRLVWATTDRAEDAPTRPLRTSTPSIVQRAGGHQVPERSPVPESWLTKVFAAEALPSGTYGIPCVLSVAPSSCVGGPHRHIARRARHLPQLRLALCYTINNWVIGHLENLGPRSGHRTQLAGSPLRRTKVCILGIGRGHFLEFWEYDMLKMAINGVIGHPRKYSVSARTSGPDASRMVIEVLPEYSKYPMFTSKAYYGVSEAAWSHQNYGRRLPQ